MTLDSRTTTLVAAWLLVAATLGLASLSPVKAEETCILTLHVRNCSGAALTEVEIEVEKGEERLKAVTDADGRVVVGICKEDVGEVFVYLIEGGAPVAASPDVESDPARPNEATGHVVIC